MSIDSKQAELLATDRAHWIHPVAPLVQHEQRGARIWASADGIHLTDMDGKRVQDAFSGLWCVNVGYGQQSVVRAAQEQMARLPYATGYFHFASEPAIRLAGRLVELAPEGLTRVMFGQSGSDAVDTAIRTVRYYFNAIGQPSKKHFIALQRGYHGSTATGSGLTALPVFHRFFDVPGAEQHHLPSPYAYRHESGPDEAAVLRATVAALEAKVAQLGAGNVAAFICEPIQGSGGVVIPPPGFLKAMREACDRLDILLIVDEVITGFGRTGPLFACGGEGVTPDLMTMAKGLTAGYAAMSATMVTEKIYQAIAAAGADGTPFGHGSTYAGHPVSAAVANAVLDLYLDGGLLANGQKVGRYFEQRLKELEALPCVGEVRVRGLLGAVELVADKASKARPEPALRFGQRVLEEALERGLVFRAFGDDILGFAPSLNYTEADVDVLIERLRGAIEHVLAQTVQASATAESA
ncbi:aminotransferase class III-fold pyridoxal phosphate-dependent enzyme [Xylophilus sp. GOD-11R]|uniref:aminotransferase class III-fold pyridoxal phosphate-dependent enzyme n=1 Tax=Xylophilus sp. GOD-11R TaxID=3089814 RepID=UPI00298C94AC|nr:aminotransferase class III-fold pyridoxal phosphate-dependent enzyme [Xylophilus sp. GOD-11R]WPB58931.1 aminotransferase class III-fold pyridoxal phosphate-dependent enzyme [Xylophilus sp. GOD-11R]